MKLLKISILFLTTIFVALAAFNFLVVLPEYCACKDATENATVEIMWKSYAHTCIGDSAEFSLVFFKMIGCVLLLLLLVIILLIILYRKKKRYKNE